MCFVSMNLSTTLFNTGNVVRLHDTDRLIIHDSDSTAPTATLNCDDDLDSKGILMELPPMLITHMSADCIGYIFRTEQIAVI